MLGTTPQLAGPPDADIVLVGEAPSTEEFRRGAPFVGPAGEVLDHCLAAAGIERSSCRIINVWGERVRKDDAGNILSVDGGAKFWTGTRGFTDAGWEAASQAHAALQEGRPNILVALGTTALSLLDPSLRQGRKTWAGLISRWRGSIWESPVYQRKMTATFHPANVVHGKTENQHVIAGDLARALEQSTFPEVQRRPRELLTDPSERDIADALARCRDRGRFWFDVELLNGQLSAFNFTCEPDWGMCVPFLLGPGVHRWSERGELGLVDKLASLLEDPMIGKGNQNILFDMWAMLWCYGIHTRGAVDDPMILHHIVFPDLPKSLAFLCSWLTDVPFYKDDGGKELWRAPWENMHSFWEYGCRDAFVPLECFERMVQEHGYLDPARGYLQTYRNTINAIPGVLQMMVQGVPIDVAGMKRGRDAERTRQIEALARCQAAGLENPLSSKQCAQFFGLGASADKFALLALIKAGGPLAEVAKEALVVRRAGKQVSNYFEMPLIPGGFPLAYGHRSPWYMMTNYNMRGTNTGRLSSSGSVLGGGANEQNLTPEFTRWMVPEGWLEGETAEVEEDAP